MMKSRIWVVLLIVLMLAGILVSACGTTEEEPTEPGETGETQEPAEEPIEVVIAQGIDVRGWDIHDHNNTATEAVHVNVFDYLVWRNDNMDIEPALATEWEKIDDTTWRFKLRDDVYWHDGEQFTAEDVKFTLERIANPETGSELREHGQYKQIQEVKIIDDFTIEIITFAPEPVLLNRLCRLGSSMLPKHYLEEVGWEGFEEHPIGTGPYKFVEWIKDDRLILEANDDYWRGRPQIDRLVFRAIPEDATRVAEVLTGGVDIGVNIPPQEWENIRANDDIELVFANSQRVMLLVDRLNPEYKTSDPNVRAAIDYAIDNQALVDNIMGGAGTPCRTRVTPGNFGANPDLYDTYLYDPDKARQLLEESTCGVPCEITFHAPAGRYPMDKEIAQAVAGMLEQVGFKVNLNIVEFSVLSNIRQAQEHQELYLIGFANSLWDAHLAVNSLRQEIDYEDQHYHLVNDEFEQLTAEAAVEMDTEKRKEMYWRIQEIIAENHGPQIFLFQLKNAFAVNNRVDFQPRADEMLWMWPVTATPK